MIGCSSKELEQQLQQSKDRETQARKRINTLQTNNNQLKERVDNAEEAENKAKDQAEQARKRVDALQKDNNQLKKQVNTLHRDNSQLKERVNTFQRDNSQLKKQVNTLQRDNSQLKERVNTFQGDNSQLKKRNEDLEKKIALVPQAEIESVHFKRTQKWRKKGIEISGKFQVSNRKGHKVWATAYFYFADGRPLRDNNEREEHKGQVAARQDFKPEYVKLKKAESFKLFMPYDELHVEQADDLRFEVRIYDETTDSYLEITPYSQRFRHDPFATK